ncbi:MAG: winged helix-turn-helix domain-containing protein [Nitrososphaera sp.]
MALLASIVISLSISTMAVSRLLIAPSTMQNYGSFLPNIAEKALDEMPSTAQNEGASADQSSKAPSPGSDSEGSPTSSGGDYGGGAAVPDDRLLIPSTAQDNLAGVLYSPVYESSPYILPITWGAVAGTLIWRGKVRSQWCRQGYDYDMFRLLARMKGSPIRVALLTSVSNSARTRAQMAGDLDVDWKTIDNHIDVLSKNGLVQEIGAFGTSRYFAITEHGRRVLSLLLSLDSDGVTDIACNSSADYQEVNAQQSVKTSLN